MQLNPHPPVDDGLRQLLGAIAAPPPAPVPTPRHRYVWVGLVLGMSALLAAGLGLRPAASPVATAPGATEAAAPAVGTATPPAPAGRSVLDATGYVHASRQATVSSEVTGRLAHVYTHEGDYVKKGQVLADLETANVETQIGLARAELASRRNLGREAQVRLADANQKFERTRSLMERGFVSHQQLDGEQFNVRLLQAQLQTSEGEVEAARRRLDIQLQQLANTRIVAPFDGLVIEQPAQVGEIVSPISAGGGFTRTGICTLIDINDFEVEVNVNEQFIGKVGSGQNVSIRPQAYPDLTLKGKVRSVMPAASRDTAAVKVRIAFVERDARVLPNMGVNIAFE